MRKSDFQSCVKQFRDLLAFPIPNMKIVVAQSLSVSKEKIEKSFKEVLLSHELIYYDTSPSSDEDLISRTKDADILVVSNYPVSRKVIHSSNNLKMISVSFIGFDHVDLKACKERNIVVTNTPGYCKESVAELAVGFAICLLRKILKCDTNTRTGKWREGLTGNELSGKMVGVIGLGNMGTATAKKFVALGCKVLGYECIPKKIPGVKQVQIDKILSESDIITLHIPLTEKTRGFIGREEFEKMKNGSYLINLARGPIVDKKALIQALNSGKLAGAAIDVYDQEPVLPNDELLKTENIILTPHIGFASEEALNNKVIMTFQNIRAFIDGKPINVVK